MSLNMEKIKKAFFILLGIFSALVLMEMILHFTDKSSYDGFLYDNQTGLLLHKPETEVNMASTCFNNNARINSFGFYGPEISTNKNPNQYLILITGSSFVESLQVPLIERFDTLLQNKLNQNNSGKKYKVISMGFAGNGTFLDMLYFKNYGAVLHPNLVINLMTDYDLKIDSPNSNHTSYFDEKGDALSELPIIRRNPAKLAIQGMMRKSKLIMNLYYKYLTVKEVAKTDTNKEIASSSTESLSWNTEDKLLKKFSEVVKDSGAKFLLTSWTEDIIPNRNFMKENLLPITQKNKINYFDPTYDMDKIETETGTKPTWACDGHWNKDGHTWVANILFQYLKNNDSLLK